MFSKLNYKGKLFSLILLATGLQLVTMIILTALSSKTLNNLTADFQKRAFETQNLVINSDRDLYQANTGFHSIFHSKKGTEDFDNWSKFYLDNINDVNNRVGKIKEIVENSSLTKDLKNSKTSRTTMDDIESFLPKFSQWIIKSQETIELYKANGLTQQVITGIGETDLLFDEARQYLNALGETLETFPAMLARYNRDAANKELLYTFAALGLFISFVITYVIKFVLSDSKNLHKITSAQNEILKKLLDEADILKEVSQREAQNSSEQAAAIQETSATMEETSSMVKQNTENTRQAALLSNEAQSAALKGVEKIGDMNKSMKDINESSNQISNIMKVIDDIAFQTNILALNAAVEAARAGEAGAGFAVVAEEVRNLAQRSANAAKDITQIIEINKERSLQGYEITDAISKSLEEINEKSSKVNKIIAEIASASEEQTKGIDQISSTISQMEQVTQTNAATAQENAAASEDLKAQAEQLQSVINDLNKFVKGSKTAI